MKFSLLDNVGDSNKDSPPVTEVTLPLRRTTVPNRSDDDKGSSFWYSLCLQLN